MQNAENLSPEQIRCFLESSQGMAFAGQERAQVYAWIEAVLVAQEYGRLGKKERGLVRAYIQKMSGLSAAHLTRLIRSYLDSGRVQPNRYQRHQFARRYSEADIRLLAAVDRAHGVLSGPATRCILTREYAQFGKPEFQRLAGLSVSHLYNLRQTASYRRQGVLWVPTRASAVAIAERRRPDPQGRPGFLRVDTVHQGDWEGAKGVYHINAVDAVTQWQVVGCTSRISEHFLIPVLKAMLHQFPFWILGFHADNGTEFINHRVAKLLGKLLVEFTKSRAHRSQDNALVEGKNGAVIRKHMGYGHIAGEHAEALQKFYTAHLNPYLNYHRPCGFATVSVDARGKRLRRYKAEDYATPYEKLKSLPQAATYLKPGISFARLDALAGAMSDTECAQKMSAAKARLLQSCKSECPIPPRFS